MALPGDWATPEDFATLFQYFWHRDFPLGLEAPGARRVDWTIHIGIVVRNVADLMGLVTRFERGGRKDAILRSRDGDEIAAEWEWSGVLGEQDELDKLKSHRVWSPEKGSGRLLRFAVLITYCYTRNIARVYNRVADKWGGARWPLLLILINVEKTKKFRVGKEFKSINVSVFDPNKGHRKLRAVPAFPWNVESTRWHQVE